MRKQWTASTSTKEVLVNVCLHGIDDEYRVLLENPTFSSFLNLMEASRRTNESVRGTPKPNRIIPAARSSAKRRQMIATVEEDEKEGSLSLKRGTQRSDNHEFK